jgi:hypothetical protein
MREFVVEQYLGAACSHAAAGRAGAARLAAEQLTGEGTPIHFVRIERITEAVTDSGARHKSPGDPGRTPALVSDDERECGDA